MIVNKKKLSFIKEKSISNKEKKYSILITIAQRQFLRFDVWTQEFGNYVEWGILFVLSRSFFVTAFQD